MQRLVTLRARTAFMAHKLDRNTAFCPVAPSRCIVTTRSTSRSGHARSDRPLGRRSAPTPPRFPRRCTAIGDLGRASPVDRRRRSSTRATWAVRFRAAPCRSWPPPRCRGRPRTRAVPVSTTLTMASRRSSGHVAVDGPSPRVGPDGQTTDPLRSFTCETTCGSMISPLLAIAAATSAIWSGVAETSFWPIEAWARAGVFS